MPPPSTSARQALGVYALVCAAVFGVTRLEPVPGVGRYVSLMVAAIFLLTAVRLTRNDPTHYGLALGGLLEPPGEDRLPGPFGVFDLARAIVAAMPSGLRELAAAAVVAVVVFPLYAAGYYIWSGTTTSFALELPPDLLNAALAQLEYRVEKLRRAHEVGKETKCPPN